MSAKSAQPEVIIYHRSPIFYWWPVWVYGYFCAIWTALYGSPFEIGGHKAVKVYSDAWLGLTFIVVLLAVLWSSHNKVRGINSLVALLAAVAAGLLLQELGALWPMFSQLKLLLVYMNQAFFVAISTGFLAIWILAVFVVDPMRFWRFRPGQIVEGHRFTVEERVYPARGVEIKRLPNDFLIHKILGFAFLGGGTGDLELTTVGAVRERIVIENVWRPKQRKRQIEDLFASLPREVR